VCGVSECDREALIKRRLCPSRGCCTGCSLSVSYQYTMIIVMLLLAEGQTGEAL